MGQVTSQTDGNKHVTKYVRNLLEEIEEEVNPLGKKTLKEYDAAGNLVKLTDPAKRTITYKYDPASRLEEVSYSSGNPATVKYEYNKDGDRTKMTDGTGTTTYTYDQLDRVTESENGHKEVSKYEYNLGNQQTKITYPNTKAVERAYDKDGRLEKVTDWNSKVTKFSYNADSELEKTTFPSETKDEDTYAYNDADQMTEVKMKKSTETLGSLVYTRDDDNQVKKTTSKDLPGAEVTEDTYDENSRLTKSGSTEYKYDAANNPTTEGSSTNTFNEGDELEKGTGVTYSYDELGERTKMTPERGPATTYGYDQAGNLISAERPEEGETSEIKDTYAYNGEDLRVSQTISGTTSYLAWDMTEELPLILSDGTNSYIYGVGGLPVEQVNTSTGAVLYLHHDQQGSTRLLTGSTGKTEGAYTYTPYGAVQEHTGTSTTPLGYDGQYTSSDTELIYMRARTYDPVTAQFLTVDPEVGMTRAPYNYADDNPLNHGDPTDLSCGLTEPWDCATEPIEATVHFVEQHPVILPILGCTVGLLAGPEVCGGAVVAAFTLSSRNNIAEYLNGNLTKEQFANKELETTLVSVLSALPGAIADRITSLEEALKESPAALQLLIHTALESPDIISLEDQLTKLESEHSCGGQS
jgi:RHS repeat-associated protein